MLQGRMLPLRNHLTLRVAGVLILSLVVALLAKRFSPYKAVSSNTAPALYGRQAYDYDEMLAKERI